MVIFISFFAILHVLFILTVFMLQKKIDDPDLDEVCILRECTGEEVILSIPLPSLLLAKFCSVHGFYV